MVFFGHSTLETPLAQADPLLRDLLKGEAERELAVRLTNRPINEQV
jgi:hypothetical protein